MSLKASEVRFWQEVFTAAIAAGGDFYMAVRSADMAVESLRNRLETPDPRPDAGRL